MAPTFFLGASPIRMGVSTTDHLSFTNDGELKLSDKNLSMREKEMFGLLHETVPLDVTERLRFQTRKLSRKGFTHHSNSSHVLPITKLQPYVADKTNKSLHRTTSTLHSSSPPTKGSPSPLAIKTDGGGVNTTLLATNPTTLDVGSSSNSLPLQSFRTTLFKAPHHDFSDLTLKDQKGLAHKHKHEHKMLGEMLLQKERDLGGSSRSFGEEGFADTTTTTTATTLQNNNNSPSPPAISFSPTTTTNNASRPNTSTSTYSANQCSDFGLPQTPTITQTRAQSSQSIRPSRCLNSSIRLGFSGHELPPNKRNPYVKRIKEWKKSNEEKEVKRHVLLDTPVYASEGVLKESRSSAWLKVVGGEFRHRDRIPVEEKIALGRENARTKDLLRITAVGGISYNVGCADFPYEQQKAVEVDGFREKLDWLKGSAFVTEGLDYGKSLEYGMGDNLDDYGFGGGRTFSAPGDGKRPRSKGMISKTLSSMSTEGRVSSFVPMAMRPETLPGTLKAYTGVDGTARKKDPIITHLTHLTEKEKRKVER